MRPVAGQIDDLLGEIRRRTESDERVLVTTLTKKTAEDLSEYLQNNGVNCKYMHYDIETIERIELLRGLRAGEFDVLVGINLLREGLICRRCRSWRLTRTRQGFSPPAKSPPIQTIGRAARNAHGKVIMQRRTRSPARCAAPSTRPCRAAQDAYAAPKTIVKEIRDPIEVTLKDDASPAADAEKLPKEKKKQLVEKLTAEMTRGQGAGLRDRRCAARPHPPAHEKSRWCIPGRGARFLGRFRHFT